MKVHVEWESGSTDVTVKTDLVQDSVKKFCFTCMQPANPECEICWGNIRKEEKQLEVKNYVLFALQSPNAKLD